MILPPVPKIRHTGTFYRGVNYWYEYQICDTEIIEWVQSNPKCMWKKLSRDFIGIRVDLNAMFLLRWS